jgi:hypothetical protein
MIQFDPLAGLLSIIAIWFAWRVEVRNTTACAQTVECRGGSMMSVDENNADLFQFFRIRIRNLGIPLYNPTAHLVFWVDDEQGCGTFSFQMRRLTNGLSDHQEFAKGMIAEFVIQSYQLNDHGIPNLLRLVDSETQNARIVIDAQGFEAVVLPLVTRVERLRNTWNRWAGRINMRFWRRRITKTGEERLDAREILPTFARHGFALEHFVEGIRRERGAPVNWATLSAKSGNQTGS